jgi:hypothetical protein
MANQPTAPTDQPPPELPNMPDVSDTLSRYLRTFSVWCRNGFRDKLSANSAAPGVMLQATDAATGAQTPFVYLVGVKVTVTGGVPSAPTVTMTLVPTGSGKP